MYKAVINDNYLIHYNKNHSSKNGQFVSGDGDGDGVANDHAHRGEKKIKGDISKGTWKNNAGVNLKFVSPKGLKQGYWIDADTGKKASAGNQWRKTPKEFQSRERKKALIAGGVAAAAVIATQVGIHVAEVMMDKKHSERAAAGARMVDDMRRANAAKLVGGDW